MVSVIFFVRYHLVSQKKYKKIPLTKMGGGNQNRQSKAYSKFGREINGGNQAKRMKQAAYRLSVVTNRDVYSNSIVYLRRGLHKYLLVPNST